MRLGRVLWHQRDPFAVGLAASLVALFVNDLFGQGFFTSQIGSVLWFTLGMLSGRAEDQELRETGTYLAR